MKFLCYLITFLQIFLISCNQIPSQNNAVTGIIPKPVLSENIRGQFKLEEDARISVSGDPEKLDGITRYFIREILNITGIQLQLTGNSSEESSIQFLLKDGGEPPESYRLTILPGQMKIEAGDAAGLFYGIQTFLQMIASGTGSTDHLSVSCIKIEDEPEFKWRGMHLDVS
ncbi:MAG: glycoside hydrolase family 20 zincin-like fold domain-containing protein, partial [Bacteroidales bacterium]|nr:glycoside hydrolase family 20 zincin-like fold domain-containing protein [Bacteroidales bacterium]